MDCDHDEQELVFEEIDGWPCLVEVICEACNANVIELYSPQEIEDMERDERSFQADAYYDSLRDAELERPLVRGPAEGMGDVQDQRGSGDLEDVCLASRRRRQRWADAHERFARRGIVPGGLDVSAHRWLRGGADLRLRRLRHVLGQQELCGSADSRGHLHGSESVARNTAAGGRRRRDVGGSSQRVDRAHSPDGSISSGFRHRSRPGGVGP